MTNVSRLLSSLAYKDIYRELGVYPATFARWKSKRGAPDVLRVAALLKYAERKKIKISFTDVVKYWKDQYEHHSRRVATVPKRKVKTLSSKPQD